MGFADHAAKASKDQTKVGAVLVRDRRVLLTAFNGPPAGVRDLPERFERPIKYLFASHAEANLIAFAARSGITTEGAEVYTTHFPCASCARSLIQAGIKNVTFGAGAFMALDAERPSVLAMFDEAGVHVFALDEP
ncbi:deoxycytidylate deaminase [Aureimonas sp. AU40]|uniref:deoxycytidylate deaminase n=1 Tax=Aureimonas sp. AU40 TaxID=1637747 RepID=UPI000782FB62|nr:dCMP deaminase family protein [Aureimonas sp. AU40]